MTVNNATPLIALEALVIDSETTGLDPAKARIVEIAAVRLAAGAIEDAASIRALINPGAPIRKSHRKSTALTTQQCRRRRLSRKLGRNCRANSQRRCGLATRSVLISPCSSANVRRRASSGSRHARFARACCRKRSRTNLGGYSLEHLAAWLGVELSGRHSALGDAGTTARIFLALLPKLRERSIRTLAEAEQACRSVGAAAGGEQLAGWSEVGSRLPQVSALGRIDTYPYRHRVADVMSTPVRSVNGATQLAAALRQNE